MRERAPKPLYPRVELSFLMSFSQNTSNLQYPEGFELSYNIESVRAPVLTGRKLKCFTYFCTGVLGRPILNYMLCKNKFNSVTLLASELENKFPQIAGVNIVTSKSSASGENLDSDLLSNLEYSPAHPRFHSVSHYHNCYLAGSQNPLSLIKSIIQKAVILDSQFKFIQQMDEVGAITAAEESTKLFTRGKPRSIFEGVPILFKSDISVKGLLRTKGRKPNHPSNKIMDLDDDVVKFFRDRGAIILGTTVMHEFGVSTLGYNSWYKGPLNPMDKSCFPGGSSSGCAVAVALGLVPVAIGRDGGGSVRIPAAWCGVSGLAPTFGIVPFPGDSTSEVTRVGPIAGCVQDLDLSLRVLSGKKYDSPPKWSSRKIKLGIFRQWVTDSVSHEVSEVFQGILDYLCNQGLAELVEINIPFMKQQQLSHITLLTSTTSFNNRDDYLSGQLEPLTSLQLNIGNVFSATNLIAARRVRDWAVNEWLRVLTYECDVILTPTAPFTAPKIPAGSEVCGLLNIPLTSASMKYMFPVNLAGLCGLTVPVGDKFIGVQIIGLHNRENDCLNLGSLIENSIGPTKPGPFWVDVMK